MAPRSGRSQRTTPPLFEEDGGGDEQIIVAPDDIRRHFESSSVSISLKYYSASCECFSRWEKNELKKFSQLIDKIKRHTAEQLQRGASSLCKRHKGKPSRDRFRRPSDLSVDLEFFELRVDQSNKARVHGFFIDGVFFLVWLDRGHECFPER